MRVLIFSLVAATAMGCNSSRRWFGDNAVVDNVKIGRQAQSSLLALEANRNLLPSIEKQQDDIYVAAKDIEKSSMQLERGKVAHALSDNQELAQSFACVVGDIRGKAIEIKEQISAQRINSEILKSNEAEIICTLERIDTEARGKVYKSKTMIAIYYIFFFALAILLLAVAFRMLPAFQPVNRALSGIFNAVIDMASGLYDDIKKANIDHLDKTQTLKTEELPLKVQEEILRKHALDRIAHTISHKIHQEK